MSNFKTSVPIDIESVKALLPKDHIIEKVVYDKDTEKVELFWHTGLLTTPYTFPMDISVDELKAKKLPENVTHTPRPEVKEPKPFPTEPAHLHGKAKKKR